MTWICSSCWLSSSPFATAGWWWMFRPKAGKVVICEKCGARYAVVQPPKYTNGWNYDKIARTGR